MTPNASQLNKRQWNPVIHRFLVCFLIVPLLVACDRPRNIANPDGAAEKTESKVTRVPRPPRGDSPDTPKNLRAALKTARKIAAPEAREKAVAEVAWNAMELDPDLALEAFQQLSTGNTERMRLIQHLAMRLAEQNPGKALEWAASLGSEKETAAANGRIALVLSDTDPERAADLLSESGIEGRAFDVAVVQVLQRWAAKAPPDAAAWVVSFPSGQAREAGIKTVISQWAETDARAAFAWMATLQDESIRKETALAMAEALLQQPREVRDAWVRHADSKTRLEMDQQKDRAMQEVGDNIPPPSK